MKYERGIDWDAWNFDDDDADGKDIVKAIQHRAASLVVDEIIETLESEDECYVSLQCLDGENVKVGISLLYDTSAYAFVDVSKLSLLVTDGEGVYEKSLDALIGALRRLLSECEEMKANGEHDRIR